MVIEEVRKQVGPFFPIMLRLSADELMEGGNTLEDTLEYLEYVQDEVDIFDVSCGFKRFYPVSDRCQLHERRMAFLYA